MRTRVFRSGNSQAVRIPAELQLPPDVKEVEIETVPGGLRVSFAQRRLTGLAGKFAALGALGVFPDGRPPQDAEDERDWGRLAPAGKGKA